MNKIAIIAVLAGLLLLIGLQSVFIVKEGQQALVLQFGHPEREVFETGLQFKSPFIQQVEYFDKRILEVDPTPNRVILANESSEFIAAATGSDTATNKDIGGEPIIVDTFARYRITSPLKFRQSLRSERDAAVRLESVMNDTTRNVLGNVNLQDLLSDTRGNLMEEIKKRVNDSVKNLGIDIVDIRIGRADLTENMKRSTFNRMISDFNKRATETRAKGQERALEIRSKADKEKAILLSEAKRDADLTRGAGDQEATDIYADSYNKDKDFYGFYRSLQAYRKALDNDDTLFILSPENDFLKTFKSIEGR